MQPTMKRVMFAGELRDALWYGTVTDPRDGTHGELFVILLQNIGGEPHMWPVIKWLSF